MSIMRTGQWAEDQLALGWCFGEPVTFVQCRRETLSAARLFGFSKIGRVMTLCAQNWLEAELGRFAYGETAILIG